jgi:hypothetical protein
MPAVLLGPAEFEFYSTQSAISDPGPLAAYYDALPDDPRELAFVVRRLMIHRVEGELFDFAIAEDRLHDDAETRYVDEILKLLVERSDAPLTTPRAHADRFVGVCRDFALLLCSFLRAKGIAARIRSGFADYFGDDGFHVDHVVTEYWDAERGWLFADAALTEGHEVDFDPMDVPRDRFLAAGKAWQLIRAGGDDEMDPEIYDLYDLASRVVEDEIVFEAARTLFTENTGLRTPAKVLSLAPFNGPREVALRR